ncbi:MAG: hypothetical protein A3G91_04440 [Omnitrophica WOR_2 bacterium RIFCSPLOWO2_12_FULL_50_9]|nr:MAG: hypothetical protein A3D87_03690 [Omnitrophica WOR_2 bacterium RIFCSPHIGHO2_02_FULL_50_17]OGX40807.1 MAG: hypothetical protein A3G91_04440 [Omnitrophica WOR_2 bacterium RIFCSPLOWO2_12_FULL_50_9]
MMEKILFFVIVLMALFLGFFVYRNPMQVIEIQKRFYELINWRMEPISMPKEIRNTRFMGLFLIVFTVICSLYYWLAY